MAARRERKAPNRTRESYLAKDPARRQAQLANLRRPPDLGNSYTRKHGASATVAENVREAKAQAVFGALAADVPVKDDGALPATDGVAVRLLADTLCRLDSIGAYLAARGWQDDEGKPRPVLDYEAKLRAHALDLCESLGMTPRSRAKLGLDLRKLQTPAEALGAHLEQYGGAG